MSRKKLLERKKKKRELQNKEKILKRRERLRKQVKYNQKIDADVKASEGKIEPYINPEKEQKRRQQRVEENLNLLKKLQKEHDDEIDNRKQFNDKMEAEGHLTLQQKMDALKKKAEMMADVGMVDFSENS